VGGERLQRSRNALASERATGPRASAAAADGSDPPATLRSCR
jgi:hypothetical protein